jgi:predicted DNA-binding transcriptional regulator
MKVILVEEILAMIGIGDRDVDDPGWLDRISTASAPPSVLRQLIGTACQVAPPS